MSLKFFLASILSTLLIFVSISFSLPQIAFAEGNSSQSRGSVVLKDKKNNVYCKLSIKENTCDLASAAAQLDGEKRANDDSTSDQNDKITGDLSLVSSGDNYEVTLNNVNAKNLILSSDDPVILKSSSDSVQKLAGIIETENTATFVIESGSYELNNANGAGISTAGRFVLKKSVKLDATGSTAAIKVFGALIMDEEVILNAKLNEVGSGSVISVNSLESNAKSSINIDVSNDNPNQNIIGLSTINGGSINLKYTELNINAPVGISTISSLQSVGNVFIYGGKTNINSPMTGIQTNNLSTYNNASLNINAVGNNEQNEQNTLGIATTNNIDFNNSSVNVSAEKGIIANSNISLDEGSVINVKANTTGLSVAKLFEMNDTSSLQVLPIDIANDSESAFIGAYFGGDVNISLIDEDNVKFSIETTTDQSSDVQDNQNQNKAILAGGKPDFFTPITFDIKLDNPETQYLQYDADQNCLIQSDWQPQIASSFILSDTTKYADESVVFKQIPETEYSTFFSNEKVATNVLIQPKEINIIVKLFYKYTLWFITAVITIILLLTLLLGIVLYKVKHRRALVIMNIQNDYLNEGPLKIADGAEIEQLVRSYVTKYRKKFKKIYAVKQVFTPNSEHFAKWPSHCVENTFGARLTDGFEKIVNEYKIKIITLNDSEPYDAFKGNFNLEKSLQNNKINHLYFIGNTFDYAILKSSTNSSALFKKKHVHILQNLVTTILPDLTRVIEKLEEKSIRID